jgi:hypothetical protein
MRKFSNKRGGITVFLTSILITMIMASMVFVHAARSICGASYSDAVLELAGRSVLSEFDRRLKDEYGIFAFYGYEDMVAYGINLYASASFNKAFPGETKGAYGMINDLLMGNSGVITDLFRLKLQKVNVDLADYSLLDADVFEKQIESHMNYMIAQKGIEFIRAMWKKDTAEGAGGSGEKQSAGGELKNNAEIQSLPSKGKAPNGVNIASVIAGGIPSIDKVLDQGTLHFKVNEYILSHFKYAVGGGKDKDTFFQNEVEYILYGKM